MCAKEAARNKVENRYNIAQKTIKEDYAQAGQPRKVFLTRYKIAKKIIEK